MKPNSVPYKLMLLIKRVFAAFAHYFGKPKPIPAKKKRKYKKRTTKKPRKTTTNAKKSPSK